MVGLTCVNMRGGSFSRLLEADAANLKLVAHKSVT
jgi:hypothetical protein